MKLKITDWVNNFSSKSGNVGTLLVLSGVADVDFKLNGKDIKKGEAFETVSWNSNPEFAPVTRNATMSITAEGKTRISLEKFTKMEEFEMKETIKAKVVVKSDNSSCDY